MDASDAETTYKRIIHAQSYSHAIESQSCLHETIEQFLPTPGPYQQERPRSTSRTCEISKAKRHRSISRETKAIDRTTRTTFSLNFSSSSEFLKGTTIQSI